MEPDFWGSMLHPAKTTGQASGRTGMLRILPGYCGTLKQTCCALVTRIAHGVPMGGEIEYVDGSTLAYAISGRNSI